MIIEKKMETTIMGYMGVIWGSCCFVVTKGGSGVRGRCLLLHQVLCIHKGNRRNYPGHS